MVARYFGATAWVLLSIVGAFNGSLTVPNTDRTFMELGFKKVVSRWNVRRDTTKVRIMTENSRAEALATIEAHHQHSFGGCHLSCFGDWPCDAHKFATLYVEALDEQLTINERLETSTERLSPDLVPHLLEWAARWLDLTDKILSMVHDEDQPELTKELNEIAKRNPNTPMAQHDLRAIGVEYVRLCREFAAAQEQIKEME
jgi:hypothetical protein